MKHWFRFENAANDPSVVDIYIIDFIGDWLDDAINRYFGESIGVTARAFVEQLAALPETVKALRVHINSPGGDIQGGVNIANALREQQVSKGRAVETFVDGIAASIASVIAMAGAKVHMGDNALMMVHNPWTIAVGNAAEMRKVAGILDTMRGQIVNTYKWHSSLSEDELIALMDAESWMNADEAIANGLATDKVEGLKAAASITPKALAKLTIPEKYRARVEALVDQPAAPAPEPEPASAADVLRLCREGDCLDLAEGLVAAHATMGVVQAEISKARQVKAAAAQRADEITAICRVAKMADLAADYIAGGMAVDAVRAQLVKLGAKFDAIEIDGGLAPDHRTSPKARLSVIDVYAARNGVAQ